MRTSSHAALAAVFVAWAVVGSAQAPAPPPATAQENPVVLTVNGDAIHSSDINLAVQNVAARMGGQGASPGQEEVMQAATEQVIGIKLLAQEARRQEIKTDPEHIDELMQQMESQAGDRAALEAGIQRLGMSYAGLRNAIQESELVRGLIDTQIRPGVEVTDQEVSEFYADNPEMFETPERVHARHILFEAGADATDEARAAARQKAVDARKRALSGEDFAELAKELSEGPSAADGGDLGFFSADRMVEPFSKAAFALAAGEISEVVETRFGFHVIKVEERQAAGLRTLEEVSEPVQRMLVEREATELTAALVEKLRTQATIVSPEGEQAAPAGE